MLKLYPILALAATLSGCTTLETRLDAASQKQGQALARVMLPPYPADCTKLEPHALIDVGAEALSVLKRERGQLDKANARVGRCTAFYGALRDKLK